MYAVGIRQEDELVRIQRNGGRGRYVFEREIENFSGWRITQRRQQHHLAEFHAVFQRRDIHLAHAAGVHQVHAVDHSDGLRGNEVATRHADIRVGHGRIRQSHRQQRLDLNPHPSDRFLHALHGFGIGEPDAVVIAALNVVLAPAVARSAAARHAPAPGVCPVQPAD